MSKAIGSVVGFWISFAVAYCVMRWLFGAGHLAAALAFVETQVTVGFTRLRNAA